MALSNKEYLQINQALFSLTHTYESRMVGVEQQHQSGLNLSDRAVLMVLGQFAPCNSRRLSELMDINPGTISVYVQRLVKLGMIQKEQDLEDRRNWWLTLTAAGETAYQETIAGTVFFTQEFLQALSDEEQSTLHQLLLKTSHSLGFDWQ